MRRVKAQFAPVLVALGELFAQPPVKRLSYAELGTLLGAGTEAVKTWAQRGVPHHAWLRVLELAEQRGPETLAKAKSLREGVKKAPRMPQDASQGNGSPALLKEGLDGRLLDMKAAAQKIADSLKSSLEASELVFGKGTVVEMERQQALVWALKDLCRQLKHKGYNMQELFDLTDKMAGEVGLPQRPKMLEDEP